MFFNETGLFGVTDPALKLRFRFGLGLKLGIGNQVRTMVMGVLTPIRLREIVT